jgi:MraZ protein
MGSFIGSYSINMDAKGRIAIPTKAREALAAPSAGRIVVTANVTDQCLLIYPEAEWQELMPKLQAMPNLNSAARRVQRILMGYATELELDTSGRVLLTSPQRDFAKLEKKLMMIGQGKKFELWSDELWQEWLRKTGDMEELTDAMGDLCL